jgi:hypothetical protein
VSSIKFEGNCYHSVPNLLFTRRCLEASLSSCIVHIRTGLLSFQAQFLFFVMYVFLFCQNSCATFTCLLWNERSSYRLETSNTSWQIFVPFLHVKATKPLQRIFMCRVLKGYFYDIEQWFSTCGTRTPWGYAVRALGVRRESSKVARSSNKVA